VIREEVAKLIAFGSLPSEEAASDEQLQVIQQQLERIEPPLTDDEAQRLTALFHHDDSLYGMAWTLLHLIETAPECPISDAPDATANEWVRRIWDRAVRAKAFRRREQSC
jgi:hypothetical protein